MSTTIRAEMLLTGPGGRPTREVLRQEIPGLTCLLHNLAEDSAHTHLVSDGVSSVFFFIGGRGQVTCQDSRHAVDEIALFAPGQHAAAAIRATGGLSFLELRLELSPDDLAWAAGRKAAPPYFAAYSTCKTYREAIKSEKTVNRTLLPENIVPRFCAGSVQTTGPDRVGAHRHPMLEQLFVGLPGNDCHVQADEASCAFVGNMLLHIPLGAEHSVRVEPGKMLHYIWIDRFRSAADVAWIEQNHVANEP